MSRRRFFVDHVSGGRAELSGDDARHLARVLRAEPGQLYEISDCQTAYLAEITNVSPRLITFRITESLPPETPPARITLFAALIKFDRFEWLIEKATELGVARVVPVDAERSEKGLALAAHKRLDRWTKIARESSQQSRRLRPPEIAAPVPLAEAMTDPSLYRYFLEEQAGAEALSLAIPPAADRSASDTVALLTGPEGGWTDSERAIAREAGWRAVSLSGNVLRSETAAIAALAIAGHAWAF